MKITQSQLVQIIKEEAANFKKEIALKKELAQIERQLNEVHAGATHGEYDQHKPKFEHPKNPVTGHVSKDTIVEIEDEMEIEDSQEELMNALKVIAKACGLSGTIELEGEDEDEMEVGDEMGDEDEDGEDVEVDVDVEDGEGEDGEGEDGEGEDGEGEDGEGEGEEVAEEGMKEEGMKEEGMKEEGMKEEGMKEEGAAEEGALNESYEIKRMKQLAGIL